MFSKFDGIFSSLMRVNMIIMFYSSISRVSYFRYQQITNLISFLSSSTNCVDYRYVAVDCESFPYICKFLGVFSTPKLLILDKMLRLNYYDGDFSISDLSNYFSGSFPCFLNVSGRILESVDDNIESYVNMEKCLLFHNYFIDPSKAMLDICSTFENSLYIRCVFNDLYKYIDAPTPLTSHSSFFIRCNQSIREVDIKDLNDYGNVYSKIKSVISDYYHSFDVLIRKYFSTNRNNTETSESSQSVDPPKDIADFLETINRFGYDELMYKIDKIVLYILNYNSSSNANYVHNLRYRLMLMKTLLYIKFRRDYW